jgi:hypothetical protein
MAYGIVIVDDDGTETPVYARPKSFTTSTDDHGAAVHIVWCKKQLIDDPEGYMAVTGAWPGEEAVRVSVRVDGEDHQKFYGAVTEVGWTSDDVCITAKEGAHTPIEMTIVADPDDPASQRAVITVDNHGAGDVAIDFGDDTPNEPNPGDGTTETVHTFDPGIYTVTATDVDSPTRTVSKVITVPFPNPDMDMVVTIVAEPSDSSHQVGSIVVDNKGNGPVVISFGDGTPIANNTGNGVTPTVHAWRVPGTYTVTVTDIDQPWRYVMVEVAVPFPG